MLSDTVESTGEATAHECSEVYLVHVTVGVQLLDACPDAVCVQFAGDATTHELSEVCLVHAPVGA